MNPTAEDLMRQLGAGAPATDGPSRQLDPRAVYGRLSFAAGRFADKGSCNCDACKLLRAANDQLVGDAVKMIDNAPNDSGNPTL